MKKLKWGILSVSGHFRKRLQYPLKDSEILSLEAIASRSLDKAQAAADEFDIPRAYGSYQKLLDDPDIDAVYIPLPNHVHGEWVKKAADAGKHILCEKPFALNAGDTAEALKYARAKGVKVEEAFMYRFHPQWQKVKQLMQEGEIGQVTAIHCIFSYNNPDPQNIRNIKETGGGALYDIGCYAVSSARWITGKEPGRVMMLSQKDKDFDTDILDSAIMDFDGTHASFTIATQMEAKQQVTIIGTGGIITVPLPFNAYPDTENELIVQTALGTRSLIFPVCNQYLNLFEAFSRSVLEDKPYPIDSEDPVLNMKVLDALFASAETGEWTRV